VRIAVALLVLAATGVLAAGSDAAPYASQPSLLLTEAVGGNGIGHSPSVENAPYTFGGMAFCLDKPGRVTIDRILPLEPSGGLAVQDFVFVPNPFSVGGDTFDDAEATITQLSAAGSRPDHLDVPATPNMVAAVCPRDPAQPTPTGAASTDMLYVQFARTSRRSAFDQGTIIEYTSGGQRFFMLVDWFVRLCAKGDPDCG
jgi:hypothetical protein